MAHVSQAKIALSPTQYAFDLLKVETENFFIADFSTRWCISLALANRLTLISHKNAGSEALKFNCSHKKWRLMNYDDCILGFGSLHIILIKSLEFMESCSSIMLYGFSLHSFPQTNCDYNDSSSSGEFITMNMIFCLKIKINGDLWMKFYWIQTNALSALIISNGSRESLTYFIIIEKNESLARTTFRFGGVVYCDDCCRCRQRQRRRTTSVAITFECSFDQYNPHYTIVPNIHCRIRFNTRDSYHMCK